MTVNIYRIYSHIGDLQYFGSTTQDVIRRYRGHVQKYNTTENKCTSNVLFNEYGTVNTFVELLETCEEDKRNEREGWYIRNNECVNKAIPDRTHSEYQKEYRANNKEKYNESVARYRNTHKDIINSRERELYALNREKNRDAINARMREYREKNRDAINARKRELRALKKASDA